MVLGFHWRTSGDKDAPHLRGSTQFLANETIDDLRCRLALECGSSAANAAAVDLELWLCKDDEDETPAERVHEVHARDILEWTPTTCLALLFEDYPSGRSKAAILFTFPPAAPAAPAPPAASNAFVRAPRAFLWPNADAFFFTGFVSLVRPARLGRHGAGGGTHRHTGSPRSADTS